MAKKKAKAGRSKKQAARRAKVTVSARRKTTPKAKARRVAAKKPAARRVAAPRPSPKAAAPNPVRQLAARIVGLTVSGNDEASLALYGDNVESVEMSTPPSIGIDAIKQKFAGWRSMITDSRWKARNAWVDGNAIIVEWEGTVTLAATGKVVELKEIAVHEVENGKIVRERFYYNPGVLQ